MNSKKFHFIAICVAVFCLIISASAYVYSVTIDSAWSVDEQVNELMSYISKLPEKARAEWAEKAAAAFEHGAHEPLDGALPFVSGSFTGKPGMVYISPSGKAYHRVKDCRGLRFTDKITELTVSEAEKKGRSPCKICSGD